MYRFTYLPASFPGILLITFLLAFFHGIAHSADITLAWDPPDDCRVAGYNLYYGQPGTDYKSTPRQKICSPKQKSTIISGLENGKTYNFVMTSFDSKENESCYSKEISYKVPMPAPEDSTGDDTDQCPTKSDPTKSE